LRGQQKSFRIRVHNLVEDYLLDPGLTFDMESLSISLKTTSFLRFSNVPPDTLTGIRTSKATTMMGRNILRLSVRPKKKKVSYIKVDAQCDTATGFQIFP
jgi:hypothetical protein